ncbi:MAG: YihY/virulence factor BrkB family protein [Chloroflexales bacterium]|nr:YihY/virulence factor BrkB family protein [Chloroflexales bacterium]
MLSFSQARELVAEAFGDWNEDKAPRLAAALAYYTIFSLAPLLIIAIGIAGLLFGAEAARGEVSGQLTSLLGPDGAQAVEQMLSASDRPAAGALATILGIAALLFGAAGVFGQLQDALNTIWEVAPKPGRGIWGFIKDRFLSFAMVLGTGFLLLVSLLLGAFLTGLGQFVVGEAFQQSLIWRGVNLVVQAAVVFGLFTLIFKLLPDVEIAWRDVLLGAGITTALFFVGRLLIALYLRFTATGSTFGAAGSLVIVLIWIFYSAQILFFGAELTQVYARRYGSQIRPSSNAVPVTADARAQQGMPDPQAVAATARAANGQEQAPRERAVGEPAAPEAPGGHQRSPEQPENRSGPGSTIIAGATIATIVGALLRNVLRRRSRK